MNHFLGIDVSKERLDLHLIDQHNNTVRFRRSIPNTIKAVAKLVDRLPDPMHTCVVYESTGVYGKRLAILLPGKVGQLCEVNPYLLKASARTMTQTKTDPLDAYEIAFAAWRMHLTDPQRLDEAEVDGTRDEDLAVWVSEYDRLRKRIATLRVQMDAIKQIPTAAAKQVLIRRQEELEFLLTQQKQIKVQIEVQASSPEVQLVTSIKGIGTVTAAALINRIGKIERFQSAEQLKAYLGIYPAIRQSGRSKGKAKMARNGDALVRHLLFNCAKSAARHNPPCKALFDRLCQRGKTVVHAWAAVMRKLVQIVYGILRTKTPFNPEFHLTTNG